MEIYMGNVIAMKDIMMIIKIIYVKSVQIFGIKHLE